MVGYYWYSQLVAMVCVVLETSEQASQRVALLEKIAEACAFQGSHHLAAKKFTQAGNKAKVLLSCQEEGDILPLTGNEGPAQVW